jgi:hypothetical protein
MFPADFSKHLLFSSFPHPPRYITTGKANPSENIQERTWNA